MKTFQVGGDTYSELVPAELPGLYITPGWAVEERARGRPRLKWKKGAKIVEKEEWVGGENTIITEIITNNRLSSHLTNAWELRNET